MSRRPLITLLAFAFGPIGCSSSLPQPPKTTDPVSKSEELSAYREALQRTLAWEEEVPVNEIRTTWFEQGDPRVAFVCETDLSTKDSASWRQTLLARQVERHKTLTDDEVATLRRWLKTLPPSEGLPALNDLLILSAVVDGRRVIYTYRLSGIPTDVVALCGLTATYLNLPRRGLK